MSKKTMVTSVQARPDVHQLAIFLKVVEARSFTGAARLIGCTQPAISQVVSRLEEIYGGDLFERRRGAPLVLTPIGEAILPSARTILHTVDEQMVRAAATAQSRTGNLRVGLSAGLIVGPLRAGIADFTITSPEVRVLLTEASPEQLHRQLNDRTVDLMFIALVPTLRSSTLIQERLWDEKLVVALPADHALARKSALDWQDIAETPVILSTSQFVRAACQGLLDRGDSQARIEQHDVSSATLLDMVGLGRGAAIVFASAETQRADVVFRLIDEPDAKAGVDAVWPKGDRNPLRHRLLNLIREHKDEVSAPFDPNSSSTAPILGRG